MKYHAYQAFGHKNWGGKIAYLPPQFKNWGGIGRPCSIGSAVPAFHPLNFDSSISHLQNTLQHIFSWMTTNLLTLNSAKTEFLLIGLKNSKTNFQN